MADTGKAVKWEKVHVFISSTFNDMHAERDYLVKRVFPELQEWCERRKLRLVDIDLRWGVTEQDATHNRNAVKVCLERIDDCRPFFLCFLGQRRGWVPRQDEISEETYLRFPELASHAGAASITELEILHAIIKPLHNGIKYDEKKSAEKYDKVEHAFFYLRDDSYLKDIPTVPPLLRETYTNEGIDDPVERERHDRELNQWREELWQGAPPCHAYSAKWDELATTPEIMLPLAAPSSDPGNIERWRIQWAKVGIYVDGVCVYDDPALAAKAEQHNQLISRGRLAGFESDGDELKDVILADLKQAITTRYPEHKENLEESELQKELDQQDEFLYINSEGFIEREGVYAELNEYLTNSSSQLFVLTAPGGMGKSMLLANWIDHTKERLGNGHTLHFRFVGQSDHSTTLVNLLRSLMLELQLVGKIPNTVTEKVKAASGKENTREVSFEIPHDPIKILNLWNSQLTVMGKQSKTIIVIDAINQLDTGLKDLVWLPLYGLPENIKLIISIREDATGAAQLLEQFAASDKYILLDRAKPFTDFDDRRKLVNAYLANYLKEIDERHLEEIIALNGAMNPLFLKVVLSELRVFGSFGSLSDKIRNNFGNSPASAFDGILQRLENDPVYSDILPSNVVPLLFGLLAHARSGLTIEELAVLFLQELNLPKSKEQRVMALDTARLFLRQVRQFLARRDGRFDFFYESFKSAALERYIIDVEGQAVTTLKKRTTKDWHRILAVYFSNLDLWEDEKERFPTRRKVAELPYHQICAGNMWDEVEKTLCNLVFVDAKCVTGQVFELQADYRLAMDNLPEHQSATQIDRKRQERIQRWIKESIEYSRQWNTGISHLGLPEIIPSVWPWSEERIQSENKRVVHDPTRFDRLDTFERFVKAECYSLLTFGKRKGFVVQHAFNTAPAGPLHDSAAVLLQKENETHLLRRWPQQVVYNSRPALLRTLEGHSAKVSCVSVTPDGRRAISGGYDKAMRLWDVETGICLRSFIGHVTNIRCLALTPDGNIAVTGSNDIRVWNLDTGECIRTINTSSYIDNISITSDGNFVLSIGSYIQVWDASTGKCIKNIAATESGINTISGCATPDGTKVAIATPDNNMLFWNVNTGHHIKSIESHDDTIMSLSITPDGNKVLSGSLDKTLRLWDFVTGNCLIKIEGHTTSFTSVSITDDGKLAVSGSTDTKIRFWDITKGILLKLFEGHIDIINSMSLSPDGRKLISASDDKMLMVWNTESGRCEEKLEIGHNTAVNCVSTIKDMSTAVSGGWDSTIRIWNINNGSCLGSIDIHRDVVCSICPISDSNRVVSSGWDKIIHVWNFETRNTLNMLKGHTDSVSCLKVSLDNRRLISGSWDKTIRIWDLETGKCLVVLGGNESSINCICVPPNGRSAVSGGHDKCLRIWDIERNECITTLNGHKGNIVCLDITPDGRKMISGSWDKTLRLWEFATMNCITLDEHTGRVLSVAVSPDGKTAISGSEDKTLRLWDLHEARVISVFPAIDAVTAVAFAGEGQVVYGLKTGEVFTVKIDNMPIQPCVVTPVRFWLYATRGNRGCWDETIKAICPLCRKCSPIPKSILDIIYANYHCTSQLRSELFYTSLPSDAWDNQELLSECPQCFNTLRFNPYILDDIEKYPQKRSWWSFQK